MEVLCLTCTIRGSTADGSYQWKDISELFANGFAVACAYNVLSDSITFSFPEPRGGRYHSELWYYTRYNTKVSESDGEITFILPPIAVSLDDGSIAAGKITEELGGPTWNSYKNTSWDTIRKTQPQVLAVRKTQNVSSVLVYPNPFTDFVNIEVALAAHEPQNIQLHDVLGRHVTTVFSHVYEGWHRAQFMSGGMDPGIYYFTVEGSGISGAIILAAHF